MNLGQFITAHSPLPTGTVAQHLAAMQFGVGTGQTIFSSRFSVVASAERTEVTRKAKRQAPKAEPAQRPVPQPKATKDAFARTQTECVAVFTHEDDIAVIQKTQSAVATSDFGTVTINRKVKKS